MGVWRDGRGPTVNVETPWAAGRLGPMGGPRGLLFGTMYEDAEIERAAFRGRGRVFCIASAGCTAMQLSQEHDVVACDINPVQLEYTRRRILGGPVETGAAERAMNAARTLMPLVGWRAEALRRFLALSDLNAQIGFWRAQLDTRRFRAGFDALLSRPLLRTIYAGEFLSFLPSGFGAMMRARLERGFARHANAANPYARALLLGEAAGPTCVNSSRVQLVVADAASFLESCEPGSFEGFALSNILDAAAPSYGERLSGAVRRAAAPRAVAVLRSFAGPPAGPSENVAEDDRSLLWGTVKVCGAQSL